MFFVFPTHNNIEGLKKFFKFNYFNSNIIVSDSSNNNLVKKFCKNHKKISYYKNSYDIASKNWNYALSKVPQGNHVLIIHDDEYLNFDDFYSIKKIKKKTDEIYLLKYQVYSNNKKINVSFHPKVQNLLLTYLPKISLFMNIIGPTGAYIFFQNIKNEHLYDENLEWLVDVDFFYRVSKNKKIIFLNEKICTNLKVSSLTKNLANKKSYIYFREVLYLKKKYKLGVFEFFFYLILSFILRSTKKLISIYV